LVTAKWVRFVTFIISRYKFTSLFALPGSKLIAIEVVAEDKTAKFVGKRMGSAPLGFPGIDNSPN